MLQKDGSIIINNWVKGVGASPYVGFEAIRCLNVSDQPGILKINSKLDDMAHSVALGAPYWLERTPYNGSNLRLYCSGAAKLHKYQSNSWANTSAAPSHSNGSGLLAWPFSNTSKSYIFGAGNVKLDVMDTSSEVWTNGWQTIVQAKTDVNGLSFHPMIATQTNVIYGGAGNKIFSIKQKTGKTFSPSDTGTYTFTAAALDLPSAYNVKCLAEMGSYLLIGTYAYGRQDIADVFLWDINYEPVSFDRVLKINSVAGINAMIVFNNLAYIQAGTKGEWFVTNGSSVEKFAQIPRQMRLANNYYVWPAAIAIVEGKIFFGLSTFAGDNGGNSGIYSLDTKTGTIVLEHLIPGSEDGTNADVDIHAILPIGATSSSDQDFLISYTDDQNTKTKVAQLSTTGYVYDNSEAYLISRFYVVAGKNIKKTFRATELRLNKPLVSGESVIIKYRTANNGSWTNYETFNTTGQQTFYGRAISNIETIQFKIILDAAASRISGPEPIEFIAY